MKVGLRVLVILLSIGAIILISVFWSRNGARAQSLDVLTISTCRADQSLYQVQIGQQMAGTGTIVSGLIAPPPQLIVHGVSVQGVDSIGRRVEVRGEANTGYVGVAFSAVIPIGKVFLHGVTICVY